MSEEKVELVRRHVGDTDSAPVLRDDDLWARRVAEVADGFHEDFEFVVHVPGEPIRGSGFDEFRASFLDWIEPLDTYHPNIEEIRDLGDRVVVLGQDRGRVRGADTEVDGPKGMVLYHFADGKVSRIDYYFDRRAGLEAAGLE